MNNNADIALYIGALLNIGAGIVYALNFKRRGLPWYTPYIRFTFAFPQFNRREWLLYGLLAGGGLTFLALAIFLYMQRAV